MASLTIDGRSYDAEAGDNLLHACLSLGLDIPYFCWHPAMGSVGACRQCAVKLFRDAEDRRGRLVMSCMTPVTDGMHLSIADEEAVGFRASVIEWLMTNHPHDCPVCPEGGECHLQDMTVMTGHVHRRYRFRKRTFRNQYLGPFLSHEMNRCIACYRCVRFYRDYAGGDDLNVFASHRNVYFGRADDGVLINEFAGNLAEVCPTGVFTDKPLGGAYVRKWDQAGAPSLCVHCGLGCNTIVNERAGRLRRVLNRYHPQINGYFLCDRGRFGHGFADNPERLRQVRWRRGDDTDIVAPEEALQELRRIVTAGRALGIGSPRASLEANFALRRLVGAEHFHLGLRQDEQERLSLILAILRDGPVPAATLKEAEEADAVLVLGEDLPNTAPRLSLSLRQAVRQQAFAIADRLQIPRWLDAAVRDAAQQDRSPLFVATAAATRLDDVADEVFRAAADDIARLGFAIAHEVEASAPAPAGVAAETIAMARRIAEALSQARRPLVVAGTSGASRAVIEAAANIAWALRRRGLTAALSFVVPECNSLGLCLMGGHPIDEAFRAVEAGAADALIVLENDLYGRADGDSVERCLKRLRHLVVIDHTPHETARRADIVLPAATFAEGDGTLVNNEGRAQRFFAVRPPETEVRESWHWLRDIDPIPGASEAGALSWRRLDEVTKACASALPALASIEQAAPGADFRIAGAKIPRDPHRYSARTAIHANRTMHEPKPAQDPDTPLAFSMEGAYEEVPPAVLPYVWAPSWNSVQAINKFQQELGGPLRGGDPGVRLIAAASGAAPAYFSDIPPPFAPRVGAWWVQPLYAIFGSEPLSRLSPPIAELAAGATLALPPADAARLGAEQGTPVVLRLNGATYRLPVTLNASLPAGTAGLTVGLPPTAGARLPAWGEVALAAPGQAP